MSMHSDHPPLFHPSLCQARLLLALPGSWPALKWRFLCAFLWQSGAALRVSCCMEGMITSSRKVPTACTRPSQARSCCAWSPVPIMASPGTVRANSRCCGIGSPTIFVPSPLDGLCSEIASEQPDSSSRTCRRVEAFLAPRPAGCIAHLQQRDDDDMLQGNRRVGKLQGEIVCYQGGRPCVGEPLIPQGLLHVFSLARAQSSRTHEGDPSVY